jgi:vacuolar-type H+-ATPase subunit I/STV1
MDVMDRLSFFAALYDVANQPEIGMWMLYATTLLLSVIVYKLGFAKKLPILKSVVIYLFLAFGCTILTFLGIFLPVAEGLMVAALILIVYKVRLRNSQNEQKQA